MNVRTLVTALVTAVVTIAVTNQVKAKQAERDLWAEASDAVE